MNETVRSFIDILVIALLIVSSALMLLNGKDRRMEESRNYKLGYNKGYGKAKRKYYKNGYHNGKKDGYAAGYSDAEVVEAEQQGEEVPIFSPNPLVKDPGSSAI